MVGIVIVSHSATLAGGVAELAREMGGEEVAIEVAAGLDEQDSPLGTDAGLIVAAIGRASAGDGVLVLMDLGSAVLSAEMALDMLPEHRRDEVALCPAPLVEGAVAAAASAAGGASLKEVAREAVRGIGMKMDHLGDRTHGEASEGGGEGLEADAAAHETRLEIRIPLGLHARPAARLVRTASRFDADISVVNATTGSGPAPARSLSGVATLGARRGHTLIVRASGPQADDALAALAALAAEGFGESSDVEAGPPGPSTPRPEEDEPEEVSPGDVLVGAPAAPGVAIGPAVVWRPAPASEIPAAGGEPEAEWRALGAALEAARDRLGDARRRVGESEAGIFDAQLLLLEDEALLRPARAAIFDDGASASAAFGGAARATAERYGALDDAYQAARAEDVEDVARRVLSHLGAAAPPPAPERPSILVADELGPADAAGLDPATVTGIAISRGSPASHAAILARALGIPAVSGVGRRALGVEDGVAVAVDGDHGVFYVEPDDATVGKLEELRRAAGRSDAVARAAARSPAVTRDGVRVEVMANIGSLAEASGAVAAGADGIGLLRTEFLFHERSSAPEEDDQVRSYEAVATGMRGLPVVLRTLDAGADKPLGYLHQPPEANPWLGVRGIRLGLAEPALLLTQLRAALRAAAAHPIRIMFPMIATLDELRAARALAEEAASAVDVHDLPEIGIMVEVPSVALCAEAFADEVAFFSIGTNDLAQYALAAERGNDRLSGMQDPLHPSVLRLVEMVCRAAEPRGKLVGVCGEAAGDPLAARVLVGLGVRELSMSLPAIARVKSALRSLSAARAAEVAGPLVRLASAREVREAAAEGLHLLDDRDS